MVDNVYYWWLMMKTEMQKGINNPYYPRAYPQRMKTSLPNRNYSLIMTSPLSTNSHITEFPLTNLLLSFSLSPHHSSLPFYYFLYKPSTPWACFDSPSPWHQLRAYQYPFLIWTHMVCPHLALCVFVLYWRHACTYENITNLLPCLDCKAPFIRSTTQCFTQNRREVS